MGLIDGKTRDECAAIENVFKMYIATGQYEEAFYVSILSPLPAMNGNKLENHVD